MLSVEPVVGPLYAMRQCTSQWQAVTPYQCASLAPTTGCSNANGDITINISNDYFGPQTYYPQVNNPTVVSGGSGIANADFYVYVTAQQVAGRCGTATQGTVAYASTC